MQEPASVFFSIVHLICHTIGWRKYMNRIGPSYQLKPLYVICGILCMNAWLWSSIFHTRDFYFTEKMGMISFLSDNQITFPQWECYYQDFYYQYIEFFI
jgi:hypothetical protein